ncbi:Arsenite methyltransferase [Triplophysa tibetana]|uniref:Arsenite methyltransferase n=1 Tax=Triplophysa tibetana TaxID=1572043 RepID=A0A5A9MW49_9TELE|nr:Arsenite methyltransferase [Triplophysa tibetana]
MAGFDLLVCGKVLMDLQRTVQQRKRQTLNMSSAVHENVKNYYGSRLETSEDLQTNAACVMPSRPLPKSACEALGQVHPDVCKRYFGCGLVIPEKLEGCKVLDLGSGSGRDCYVLSKLVGERGQVTGLDMTDEMIVASQKYGQYHQEKFGYSKANTVFVKGYMEKLNKKTVIKEVYKVLKVSFYDIFFCIASCYEYHAFHGCISQEGGELYYSDMYASKVTPESFKEDPVLWGEGMAGALYWQDLITLMKETGFSTPHLVAGSHIVVQNPELQQKTGDVKYSSGTYRIFKLPQHSLTTKALVTYKGTVPDCVDCFEFDASHSFKTNVPVEVGAEMAAILQHTRFSTDFSITMLDIPDPNLSGNPQPFLKSCGEEKAHPIGGRTRRNITAAQCRSRFSA